MHASLIQFNRDSIGCIGLMCSTSHEEMHAKYLERIFMPPLLK
jgi:hypothetical protein